MLIYCYSNKKEQKKNKQVYTKSAEKSISLGSAFNDQKFNVQVALRYFNCYEVDVSEVNKADSPVINEEEAPWVIIYHKNEIYKTFNSGSSNRIFSTLSLFLRKEGYDIKLFAKELSKPLYVFYKNERKIFKQNLELTESKKRGKASKSKLEKLTKEYESYVKISDEAKAEIDKIIAKYSQEKI